ncbi:hypothetical protein ACHAQH_009199 [Verticillium albo-atrum]
MEASVKNLFLLGFAAVTQAAATLSSGDLSAAVLCGDLGVLTLEGNRLPAGVSPAELRMCADHPNGHDRILDPEQGASLSPMPDGAVAVADTTSVPSSFALGERACYTSAPYGCSGGYCWKSCGNKAKGEWCWTAANGGLGAWKTCGRWQDCGEGSINFGSIIKPDTRVMPVRACHDCDPKILRSFVSGEVQG